MSIDPEQGQLQLQSPGEILKEEREKKKLSTADIAQQLNLKIEIIQHIEADEYEKLAAPTYTRGYLRSYAKLVDVDAGSIIDLFDNTQGQSSSTPEILPKVSKQTQITSNDKPVKLVTYLITLGLVLLVLIWWQGNFDLASLGDFSLGQEEQTTNKRGFDYDFEVIVHPDDPNYRADTRPEDYQETPLINTTDSETDLIGVPDSLSNPVENPLANTESAVETAAEQSSSSTSDETTEDATSANPSTSNLAELTLLVEKESWIEIHDADKKRLFLDLAKPGKIIQVSGKTPYSLLIGNADSVRVQFQGNDFDHSQFINSGVARFQIGE